MLRVTFLDVGQGDACVIETPNGSVIVVDGGGSAGNDSDDGQDPGSRVVVPFLRSRGISTVDLLVATHADQDHVQGLIGVTRTLVVRRALISSLPTDKSSADSESTAAYPRLLRLLRQRRVLVTAACRGQRILLGQQTRLEVLGPPHPFLLAKEAPENNNSVVLRLVYGNAAILLTGDIENEAEAELLRSGVTLRADVLKVAHHGSRGSSSARFLARVAPSVAVISCGRDNRFGHPHPEAVERVEHVNARIFRTDRHGAITVQTDGKTIRVDRCLK